MAKRLTSDQRARIAEKIMEWGNLVFAGLVIAQLVPGIAACRLSMVVAGLISIAGACLIAIVLMKGGG